MSKKKKHFFDKREAKELFATYGIIVKEMNYYQFRLQAEEQKDEFYDWYHTTGTLVKVKNGYNRNLGCFLDVEDIAILINK